MDWRIFGADSIACCMDRAELPGLIQKKLTVDPTEAIVLIRNGKVKKIMTETRQWASGFFDQVWSWFGLGDDVQVICVSRVPFEINFLVGSMQINESQSDSTMAFKGSGDVMVHSSEERTDLIIKLITSDREEVSVMVKLKVAVDLDNILPLVRLVGMKNVLARMDLISVLKTDVVGKSLVHRIGNLSSQALHTDQKMIAGLESEVHELLTVSLSDFGMKIMDVQLVFGLTNNERLEIRKKQKLVEEEAAVFNHQRNLREMQRSMEIDRARLENLIAIKRADISGDESIKEMLLSAEIQRDSMGNVHRLEVAKIDAEIHMLQTKLRDHTERLALERSAIARKIADEEAASESARKMDEMKVLNQLYLEKNQQKLRQNQAHLDVIERLAILGKIDSCVASVINTAAIERTKETCAHASGPKRNTFVASEGYLNKVQASQEEEAFCAGCGQELQPNWRACPACGKSIF